MCSLVNHCIDSVVAQQIINELILAEMGEILRKNKYWGEHVCSQIFAKHSQDI